MLNIVTLPGLIDPSETAFVIVACEALWISLIETDLLFLENNINVGTALRVFILPLRPYKKEKKIMISQVLQVTLKFWATLRWSGKLSHKTTSIITPECHVASIDW